MLKIDQWDKISINPDFKINEYSNEGQVFYQIYSIENEGWYNDEGKFEKGRFANAQFTLFKKLEEAKNQFDQMMSHS